MAERIMVWALAGVLFACWMWAVTNWPGLVYVTTALLLVAVVASFINMVTSSDRR